MWKILKYAVRKVLGTMPSLLDVGSTVPEFAVSDHAGRSITSAQLAGSRYILWFYPKADTPG